jgi:hypothetical protein
MARNPGGSTKAAPGGVKDSGKTVQASPPPKPSGMKVNQFQEASRDARQRSGRILRRADKRLQYLQKQPQAQMAADDGGRKNLKGRASTKRAIAYTNSNGLRPERFNQFGNANFRAPATRLY